MQRKRILVIDDDLVVLKFLRANLREEGYEVLTALDGTEALHVIEKELPDLIILDIMMPEKSGLELLKELKAQPGTARIPVMMASVMANPESLAKARDLGAADYTTKPFDINLLKDKVKGLLGS